MEGKLYALITYTIVGLIIALWPAFAKEKPVYPASLQSYGTIELSSGWMWKLACFVIATIGVVLLSGKSTISIILSFALVTFALSLANKKLDILLLLTTFLVFCTSLTLLWWARQDLSFSVNNFSLVSFCCFAFLFDHVFKIKKRSPIINHSVSIKWLIPYMLLVGILSFSTGIFHDPSILYTLCHHWAAYIGPAELLLSGAAIFHDFPTQYGLGPTTLIASACGHDCWQGMYFVASSCIFITSTLITTLAFALTRKYWLERLIALALSLATCFVWPSIAAYAGSPMESPSSGSGLRYLPAVLVVTYLFFIKRIEYSKLKICIAHGLWALGALWSPESAFYVTCIWWPYYIFIKRTPGNFSLRCKNIILSLVTLLLIGASLVIVFNLIYRLIYHKSPTLYAFLVYVLHPPGPLPINLYGSIWYFFIIMATGIGTLIYLWHKSGDSRLFRSGLLLNLLSYSAFCYFLGHSDDSNVGYITAFLFLILLHSIASIGSKEKLDYILNRASVICLSALLAWLPMFNWIAWRTNIESARLFSFEPKLLAGSLRPSSTKLGTNSAFPIEIALRAINIDALHAINFIQKNHNEPFTLFNSSSTTTNNSPTNVWNALQSPGNYYFIPIQERRKFIRLTAATLQRSGWLIVEKNSPMKEMVRDIDSVYQRTNQLEFGNYTAIHFSLKEVSHN